jgi:hypothetical protein
MAVPVYSVGQVWGAADVNNWALGLAAYRTSTQSVTSSTAYVNDTQLVVAVAANAVYDVRLVLLYDGAVSTGGAAGIRNQFTMPASATFVDVTAGLSATATTASDDVVFANGSAWGSVGAGVTTGLIREGLLTTAGTAGNFQFQWAQNVSSGTATRVFAGSKLILSRAG